MVRSRIPALSLVLALALTPPFGAPASATSGDARAATDLVEIVIEQGTRAIDRARQSSGSASDGLTIFKTHFAVETIGESLLGAHWQSASARDRERFIEAFGDYLMEKLIKRLPEGEFTIVETAAGPTDDSGSPVTIVRTVFTAPNSSHAVQWTVVHGAAGAKILDVALGGKSMIADKRREFAGVLGGDQQSIDALIAFLEE